MEFIIHIQQVEEDLKLILKEVLKYFIKKRKNMEYLNWKQHFLKLLQAELWIMKSIKPLLKKSSFLIIK